MYQGINSSARGICAARLLHADQPWIIGFNSGSPNIASSAAISSSAIAVALSLLYQCLISTSSEPTRLARADHVPSTHDQVLS